MKQLYSKIHTTYVLCFCLLLPAASVAAPGIEWAGEPREAVEVPEPITMAMIGCGLVAIGLFRRRRAH